MYLVPSLTTPPPPSPPPLPPPPPSPPPFPPPPPPLPSSPLPYSLPSPILSPIPSPPCFRINTVSMSKWIAVEVRTTPPTGTAVCTYRPSREAPQRWAVWRGACVWCVSVWVQCGCGCMCGGCSGWVWVGVGGCILCVCHLSICCFSFTVGVSTDEGER